MTEGKRKKNITFLRKREKNDALLSLRQQRRRRDGKNFRPSRGMRQLQLTGCSGGKYFCHFLYPFHQSNLVPERAYGVFIFSVQHQKEYSLFSPRDASVILIQILLCFPLLRLETPYDMQSRAVVEEEEVVVVVAALIQSLPFLSRTVLVVRQNHQRNLSKCIYSRFYLVLLLRSKIRRFTFVKASFGESQSLHFSLLLLLLLVLLDQTKTAGESCVTTPTFSPWCFFIQKVKPFVGIFFLQGERTISEMCETASLCAVCKTAKNHPCKESFFRLASFPVSRRFLAVCKISPGRNSSL